MLIDGVRRNSKYSLPSRLRSSATCPYARTDGEARAIERRLAALLAFARDAGAVSVGLGDVPELVS